MAQQFKKYVKDFAVDCVPVLIFVARLLSTCMVVSSTALAKCRNLPVICCSCCFSSFVMGAKLSMLVISTFESWVGV